ncbi:MAG TPA: response regulator transcription factor, partial [Chromatiaceae bacterium]|nr:response regulator transcription factor [Chromatiaceae bacterium]
MLAVAIVEDNADVLDDLLFNLGRLGFQARGFADGADLDAALVAGQAWPVLVLDLGLPGEDGLSIARRLRQSHPAIGIIALTARGRLEDRVAGLNEGFDLYLVKPVDITELAAAIRAIARRVAQLGQTAPLWRLEALEPSLIRPDGERLPLAVHEFHLLEALAAAVPDQPVARDDLIR